jgi:hypothetical protein
MANQKKKTTNRNKGAKPTQQRISKKDAKSSNKNLLIPIIIFIFSFCMYANSIKNNYAFDDDVICQKNAYVQSGLHNVKEIFTKGYTYAFNGMNTDTYRPMTLLSTALEVSLYGNKPHRHHLINVLLFSLSCVVLYLLLRKIFSNYNFILPLIITLLYSAHPIHTEVVANIKSRDEILCFLFFVFSLYFMMIYFEKKNIFVMIASGIFYLLSLLSKENAMTFFILFPMIIFYFTKTDLKISILYVIPYFIVLLAYLLIRYSVIDSVSLTSKVDMVNNSLMAATNYPDRLATAFSMLGRYLYLLIFPVTLVCDYSYNAMPIIGWGNPKAFISFLIFAGALVYAIITIRKKNYFSFAILFFMISFLAASNIFTIIGSSMAERFLFTPSLGFCIILGLAFVRIFKVDVVGNNKKGLAPMYLILGIILILYSFRTINRNNDWQDNGHLFKTDVISSPNSFRLHSAVGSDTRAKGEQERDPQVKSTLLSEAIVEYNKSLDILPTQGETWYNLGVCYYLLNDFPNAENAFHRCVGYEPKYKAAFNNLGVIAYTKQKYDTAYFYFTKAIQIDPNNADAISNIGAIMQTKGKYDEAIKYYERASGINPNNINNYSNLLKIYTLKKDNAKIDYYKKKLEALQQN